MDKKKHEIEDPKLPCWGVAWRIILLFVLSVEPFLLWFLMSISLGLSGKSSLIASGLFSSLAWFEPLVAWGIVLWSLSDFQNRFRIAAILLAITALVLSATILLLA